MEKAFQHQLLYNRCLNEMVNIGLFKTIVEWAYVNTHFLPSALYSLRALPMFISLLEVERSDTTNNVSSFQFH